MRRGLLVAVGCGVMAAACAPADPPGYDTPESVLHDTVSDLYLVSNIHGKPLEKDNNGYIARVRPDLAGMQRYWIQGGRDGVTLHAPKGMALHGDTLWVTDIDVVRRFDRRTGKPLGEIAIPGATFLNDCAAAGDGTIYCSDSGLDANFAPTGTDAIWRIAPGEAPAALIRGEALGQPNGIVARATGVYVVSWRDGTFYQVDAKGRRTDLGKAATAQLDGLVRVEGAGYLATSWAGRCVYRFAVTGECEALPTQLAQPADLGYDAVRKQLLVPLFGDDAIERIALMPR